jgi:hypothetical protein
MKQLLTKRRSYAGPTTCLSCDRSFESWDRRQNRLCATCRVAIEQQPFDGPVYTIEKPPLRSRDH